MNFDESLRIWTQKAEDLNFVFPVLFLEHENAAEAIGFETIEHFIGDIDIVCYEYNDKSILIDINGKVIQLRYNNIAKEILPDNVISNFQTSKDLLKYLESVLHLMLSYDDYEYVHTLNRIRDIIQFLCPKLQLK